MIFNLKNPTYHKPCKDTFYEGTVSFSFANPDTQAETSCTIRVPLLLLYPTFKEFKCADGSTVKLSDEQLVELLFLVRDGQEKIRKDVAKNEKGWEESGLDLFEFLRVGDEVDYDLVDYMRNELPPLTDYSNLFQTSEPYSHEVTDDGRVKPTFITFHRDSNRRWHYCGVCFRGEHENRADVRPKVEKLLEKLEREGKISDRHIA